MSQNPKATLIRNACKGLAATFRRAFGEVGRTLVNPDPAAATAIRNGLEATVKQLLLAELGKSNLPVVTPADDVPEGAHWLMEPLGGRRNFLHGRLPVSVEMAFVEEDGSTRIGAVYFPVEDVLVLAEKGTGATGPERLRVAGSKVLKDTILLLPWATEDVENLGLMGACAKEDIHTRKTGHVLFDAIDVAAGRADLMVATRLSRLECLLAGLILAEAGARATDLADNALTPASTEMVAGNLMVQPLMLGVVKG